MNSLAVRAQRIAQHGLFPSAITLDRKKLFRQRQLIARCIRSGEELASALSSIGWSYEDLQYDTYDGGAPIDESAVYKPMHSTSPQHAEIPTVSFFSGAGGMDLGFEAAGFSHIALVEHDELFCRTLRLNRPKWQVIGPPTHAGDISRREAIRTALRNAGVQKNFEGLFLGGPPCQPFSIAANQRFRKSGKGFKRIGFRHALNGNLLFDYIGHVKAFKPRVFVIENVPGLMDIDDGEQLKRGISDLTRTGYNVHSPLVLNASRFGLPQNRRRLFIVGWRTTATFRAPTPSKSLIPCIAALSQPMNGVSCHVTRVHKAESIDRYAKLQFGERDPLGRVDRLDPGLPSKTIIAGGSKGGGRSHLHPYIPRTLTVRESARLQTFPDNYEFVGSPARQFTQVGNAVPPQLAKLLAIAISGSLFSA